MSVTLLDYELHGGKNNDFLFVGVFFLLSFVSSAPHIDLGIW